MSASASLGSLEDPLVPQTTTLKRARTDDGSVITKAEPTDRRVFVHVKRSTDISAENPLVFKKEAEPGQVSVVTSVVKNEDIDMDSGLVPVRGNDKVLRCPKCNTFVKKGASHSPSECAARIQRKAAGRANASRSVVRKRIRITPKRQANLETLLLDATKYQAMKKAMPRLEKWVLKKEGRLNKTSKKLFAKVLGSFRDKPDTKALKANFRKAGLVK